MECHVVPLNREHLHKLLKQVKLGITATSLEESYFSPGSIACCILADGEPVFAGGIVNLMWNRGEAWMLPTRFFHRHTGICFRHMIKELAKMAIHGGFKRVQATCAVTISTMLFDHLGFEYEGTMKGFGPSGEACHMYSRLF